MVTAKSYFQSLMVTATCTKILSVQHLATIREKLINATESVASISQCEIPFELDESLCLLISIEITRQEDSITRESMFTNDSQDVVCCGLWSTNTTRAVCGERSMMVQKECGFARMTMLQPNPHDRPDSVPLEVRILSNVHVTLGNFMPHCIVPCHGNRLSGVVPHESVKMRFVQDMLNIWTLLKTHEVERSIAMNEVTSTMAISMPDSKQVPPKEIVSQDSDLQRITNPLWAGVTSRGPTFSWSTRLTPKPSPK